MAMPRTPLAKARTEARDKKDPQRFKGRADPTGTAPLGPPPRWVKDAGTNLARTAWDELVKDLPWLNGSHRAHLTIAASIYGRLIGGEEVGVQALNLLRQCLGQMGGNPADASKVSVPDDGEEKDDLLD
ncbi:hypothetical protein ACLBXM_09300 [Xanthobacteraceae bacterium A53D]